MPDIVTDISINQNWNARKGANNPVTFTFIKSAAAFNISTYTFSVQLRKFGSDTNLLNLTQGSGITNNGAAGTLNVVFTSANLTNLVANDYYWQMTVVNPDTFSYLWYQGTFNLYAETYTGDLTSAVTGTIDLNGTTINTSVTLGVSGVVSVVAGSNITVDNTDPLNPVISSTGGGAALTNGNGTTANGSAVDLGGTQSGNISIIDPTGTYNFYVGGGMSNNPDGIQFVAAGQAYIGRVSTGLRFASGGTTLTIGSDAIGDIYYRNSSGYLTRLAAGTNGHVLTLAAGIPSWAAPSGGSGLTVGTTTITSGTNGNFLSNNSGVLGEITPGAGVATWFQTPSWTNFNSAITGTSPYLPLTGATYTTTTGDGLALTTSTLTSGNLVSLTSTSTAAASNTNTLLNISSSGSNATSTQTVTGAKISVTNTGTSATNDALTVSSSGGTTNNAIKVSGGNILLTQAASQSILKSGGILTFGVSDFNTLALAVQNTNRLTINGSSGAFTFSTNAVSSGAITPYSFNDFARTNQTASTETNFVNWTPNTTQYATGAQTILRTYRMNPAAYSFVGASTITDAYTLWVDDPVASTNATITNNWAAGFQGNVVISGTRVNVANLPTSAAGLATGDLWNNTGVINIV